MTLAPLFEGATQLNTIELFIFNERAIFISHIDSKWSKDTTQLLNFALRAVFAKKFSYKFGYNCSASSLTVIKGEIVWKKRQNIDFY